MNSDSEIIEILERALNNEKLRIQDGVTLLNSNNLTLLGATADYLRKFSVGDLVTFVVDRNINYTNICTSKCKFCAFYRSLSDKDAYVLSIQEILQKILEAVKLGATQILLQGGLHPTLPFEFYEDLLRQIKHKFPNLQMHAFSPPEIWNLSKNNGISIKETLEILKDAGLDSIPGGGAEILVDRVRSIVSPNKISWKNWKKVMEIAHSLNIPSSATMVFNLGETIEERVKHLIRIREMQEKTRGFTAFIPWSFQPKNTLLDLEHKASRATGVDYLKLLAVSRIILNNYIKNIQVSSVTQGTKIAQIALFYGANDFGGTMIEENVVRSAGVPFHRLSVKEIVRIVSETGRPVAKRDTLYNILERYSIAD
ncbi:MAG: cyclic dehypoxanthinyl futalosine synthase [Methanosarcinales archaeon]